MRTLEKHPRRGGEDITVVIEMPAKTETPPPRRGRPAWRINKRVFDGNTPAEAGKTSRPASEAGGLRKHPRRGGEDTDSTNPIRAAMETPPPRRGRLKTCSYAAPNHGNTPAEAGKTKLGFFSKDAFEKHPRRGGEDRTNPSMEGRQRETPPPRRGRPAHIRMRFGNRGNTPAEAGKTPAGFFKMDVPQKHPRRGGEDSMGVGGIDHGRETPPPRRGRLEVDGREGEVLGNTPAEAGKTCQAFDTLGFWKKHPRRGGEDFYIEAKKLL